MRRRPDSRQRRSKAFFLRRRLGNNWFPLPPLTKKASPHETH